MVSNSITTTALIIGSNKPQKNRDINYYTMHHELETIAEAPCSRRLIIVQAKPRRPICHRVVKT